MFCFVNKSVYIYKHYNGIYINVNIYKQLDCNFDHQNVYDYKQLMKTNFNEWLNNEIQKRGWSLRETARKANLSPTLISLTLSGDPPTFNTCAALAKAFDLPPMDVFEKAGLLPETKKNDPNLQLANYKFSQLPEWQQKIVLKFMDGLIEEKGENEDPNGQVVHSNA